MPWLIEDPADAFDGDDADEPEPEDWDFEDLVRTGGGEVEELRRFCTRRRYLQTTMPQDSESLMQHLALTRAQFCCELAHIHDADRVVAIGHFLYVRYVMQRRVQESLQPSTPMPTWLDWMQEFVLSGQGPQQALLFAKKLLETRERDPDAWLLHLLQAHGGTNICADSDEAGEDLQF